MLLNSFSQISDRSSSFQNKIQLENSCSEFPLIFHFSVSPRLSCVIVQHTWRGTWYSTFFFAVKTLGWRSIFLLTPGANGLMFQCLDASPTFTFLCLFDNWKPFFFHFLFLVHWCFHQSWVISQTKQKEWDFWVQAFLLGCLFWDESHLVGLIFLHLLEGVQRNISSIGVEVETILSTILGYLSIPSALGCWICSVITLEGSRTQNAQT